MSEFSQFTWYECGFPGCSKLIYGNGIKLYCVEHHAEQPKIRPAAVKSGPADVSPELADLQDENMLLGEQLAELQAKYDALERAYEAAFITSQQYGKPYTWDDVNRAREGYLKYHTVQSDWNPLGI